MLQDGGALSLLEELLSASGRQLAAQIVDANCTCIQPLTAGNSHRPLTALLDGLDRSCRAEALLHTRPAAQQEQPSISTAAVVQEYAVSLQRSADMEAAAGCSRTAAQAVAVCHEFSAFLAARQAARGVSLLTCSPVDIKVFFETQWLKQHGSTVLSDGQRYAAPSYLETSISHLSGLFKRLGRVGDYDSIRQVRSADTRVLKLCCCARVCPNLSVLLPCSGGQPVLRSQHHGFPQGICPQAVGFGVCRVLSSVLHV